MRVLSPISTDWSRRNFTPARMGDAFENFDNFVESFLRPTFASTLNLQPSCDINETKDHYLVSFDMPGVKKEDVHIEVQANQLIISGERQRELKDDVVDANLHHERMYGRFERTFTLPVTIDAEKIEANYENGVLNVALPKAEAAKGRSIPIQTGQGRLFNKLAGSRKGN